MPSSSAIEEFGECDRVSFIIAIINNYNRSFEIRKNDALSKALKERKRTGCLISDFSLA